MLRERGGRYSMPLTVITLTKPIIALTNPLNPGSPAILLSEKQHEPHQGIRWYAFSAVGFRDHACIQPKQQVASFHSVPDSYLNPAIALTKPVIS
jgi:hypothetical protein